MVVFNGQETSGECPEPSPAFDLDSLLRRRRAASSSSATAAAASPHSSSRTASGDDSGDQASSGGDEIDQIGAEEGSERGGEEKAVEGDDRGTGGGVLASFMYRASAPAHWRVKESPLSSNSIFKQSYAGLFNLCIVVLVAVNSRLIIENLMKYGLLIRAGFWFSSRSLRDWPLLMCCLTLPFFPLGAFVVEKLAQRNFISEHVVISLHVIITTAAIVYPVIVILRSDSAVLSGLILMFCTIIVWLKLVSYAHTNYDLRSLSNSLDKVVIYPDLDDSRGITFKSLAYFMMAPTLCYQPSYPRTTCIRKGWLFRQLVKLVICAGVMSFIIEQYINPIVKNSQHPLKGNFMNAMERILKLSIPTLYMWLCMFYCFFHLWLNILAELLRFADREFYKDWWNAKTIDEPVHKWMVRHIYLPCIRHGIPKEVAIFISFFLSAVFHELCIGVPCHIFKFWAFIGIMLQVGNMIFWYFFSILGQPMCVLLYYHDVMNRKARKVV